MDNSYFYKADEVRSLAKGQWLFILAHLMPELEPALKKAGKSHVTCPFHGGKKDFRMFKDAHETGGAICSCGSWHDGFELLNQARGWDFAECLQQVGDLLMAPKHFKRQQSSNNTSSPRRAQQSAPAKVNNTKYDPNRRPKYQGTLIAHGQAPYQDDPINEPSYFAYIRLSTGNERKIWGVDLERAIGECGAVYGDEVTLTNLGREAVTVMQPVFEEGTGEIIGEKPVQTHRNTWVVEVKTKSVRTAKPESVAQAKVSNSSYVSHSAPGSYNEESWADSNVPTGLHEDNHSSCSPVEHHQEAVVEQEHSESKVVPLFAEQSKPWLMELQEEMQKRAERERVYNARLCEKIEKIWNECLPFNCAAAEPLRAYFVNRKLLFAHDVVEQTDSLRFHPSMSYYDEDGNEVGKFPAAVQAIRDAKGNLVTLHRTYLTKSGKKAKVECAKKMMPVPDGLSVTGGAVRLGMPTEGVLGLAEGLETALSGFRATHIPTWSTVNATLLENFEVPDELDIHTVVIFADKDKSLTGERSANVLKSKLEKQGYTVHVLLPKLPIPPRAKGIDWNDVLVTQGQMGFPPISTLREFIARRAGAYGRV
jgi:phage/plasmid primase-like uncharacterized protein